jgi:hypothetical protein
MYATAILRDQCVTESVKACTTSLRGVDPHDQYAHTVLVSQARISRERESCTDPKVREVGVSGLSLHTITVSQSPWSFDKGLTGRYGLSGH